MDKPSACKLTIRIPNESVASFLDLHLPHNATIKTVKETIEEIEGIDVEKQNLYYNEICLDNQCRVLSFNDCTLHLQQNKITISLCILGSNEHFMDKNIKLSVPSNATIQTLKQKIYEKEGFPVEHQVISLRRTPSPPLELNDDVILSQYGINGNSLLMLFINNKKDQKKGKRYGAHKKKRKNRGNYRRNNNNRKQQNKHKAITKQANKKKNAGQHYTEKHENRIEIQHDGRHRNEMRHLLQTLDLDSMSNFFQDIKRMRGKIKEEWEKEANIFYNHTEKEYNDILNMYQFDILNRERIYMKEELIGKQEDSKEEEQMNDIMLTQIYYEIASLKCLTKIHQHYTKIMRGNNKNEDRNKLKDDIKTQIKTLKEREEMLLKSPILQNEAILMDIFEIELIERERNEYIKMITNDQCNIYNEYIKNLQQIFVFNYKHDLNGNGIVYNIGTSFGRKPFQIPYDKIDVYLSSKRTESGSEYEILNESSICCVTKLETNPWIIIDFTPKMIKPSHYCLRYCAGSWNIEPLKYWVFEGSNDNGKTWKLLSKHENDESFLYSKKLMVTWTLSDLNEFYSHFRILQTNKKSLSCILLNEFEIYGIVKDIDDIEISNNCDDILIHRMKQKYRNLLSISMECKSVETEKKRKRETEEEINNKLSKQYDELKTLNERKLDDLNKEIEIKKDMIQLISTQKSEIEEKYNDLEIKHESLQKSADELNDKYKASEKMKQELMSNITALNNKYNECEKSNRSIQEKQDKLKQKYNAQKTEIQRLQQEKKQFECEQIELQQKCNNMQHQNKSIQFKMDRVENEYQALQKKYDQQRNRFGYIEWNAKQITNWIINIDTARYSKYYKDLLTNLEKEGIDGECLIDLNKNDLHRFGIIVFKDKRDILKKIKDLITNKNYNELEQIKYQQIKKKKCVVCCDGDRIYCCLPCGHKCLCEKCKNIINRKCPICQKCYNSLMRIYDQIT